jgi:hypothetical protein
MSVLPPGRYVPSVNNQPLKLLDRQCFVQSLVEQCHRCCVATAQAIHGDERELTVIGGLANANSKTLARAVEQLGA